MAWETKNGGRYYTRSFRRPDGSIRREYIGTGPRAERIAEKDHQAREQRRLQSEVTKKLEAGLARVTQVVEAISERSEVMLAASLLVAGYRQHKSEWRKKRDR